MTNEQATNLKSGEWVVVPGRRLADVIKVIVGKPDIQVWVIMPDGRKTYWFPNEIKRFVDMETSS